MMQNIEGQGGKNTERLIYMHSNWLITPTLLMERPKGTDKEQFSPSYNSPQ